MTRLLPSYNARRLAANVTPVFVVAALTGWWAKGLFSVLVAMVLVAVLLYVAITRSRIEPS